MSLVSYAPRSFCPTAETGAFRYTVWTRMQHVLFPHSLSGSCTFGTLLSISKLEKMQRPSGCKEILTNLYMTTGSCFYLATFNKVITKNIEICDSLEKRQQLRIHTYQLYKGKSTITVSNKKYILCSWLGNKMVPNINRMFFRRAIILQKEIMFVTIIF